MSCHTGGRHPWLRAAGLPVGFHSFVIITVAFWLPGKVKITEFSTVAASSYFYKLLIPLGATPLLNAGHPLIDRFLGFEEAHRLVEQTAKSNEELTL